jgi:hypothetical protein
MWSKSYITAWLYVKTCPYMFTFDYHHNVLIRCMNHVHVGCAGVPMFNGSALRWSKQKLQCTQMFHFSYQGGRQEENRLSERQQADGEYLYA